MTDIKVLLVAAMLASGFTQTPAPPQVPVRKLSADREVLRADVAITTLAGVELDKLTAAKVIEHDSEVGRSEHVTVIVMALGCLRDAEGHPVTAHSLNPVPLVLIGRATGGLRLTDGVLADVAPTLLSFTDIAPWPGTTGRSLCLW